MLKRKLQVLDAYNFLKGPFSEKFQPNKELFDVSSVQTLESFICIEFSALIWFMQYFWHFERLSRRNHELESKNRHLEEIMSNNMNSLPRSYDSAHTSNIDDLDDLEESRVDDINNLGGMVIFPVSSKFDFL